MDTPLDVPDAKNAADYTIAMTRLLKFETKLAQMHIEPVGAGVSSNRSAKGRRIFSTVLPALHREVKTILTSTTEPIKTALYVKTLDDARAMAARLKKDIYYFDDLSVGAECHVNLDTGVMMQGTKKIECRWWTYLKQVNTTCGMERQLLTLPRTARPVANYTRVRATSVCASQTRHKPCPSGRGTCAEWTHLPR